MLRIAVVLLTAMLAALVWALPARADGTKLKSSVTTIHAQVGFGKTTATPVKVTPEQIREENDEDEEAKAPHVTQVPAPDGPPVPPTPDDTLAALTGAHIAAADDYVLLRAINITPGAGNPLATGEPTVANARDSLLYTGNKYAAVSADNGLTWQGLNPFDGTRYPQYDGGFCCDQVAYAVDRGHKSLVFWLRQMNKDTAKNPTDGANGSLSLIVFQGGSELDEVATQQDYCEYRFRPSDFGQIAASWFDFNQMSNTKKYVYFSSKAEQTSNGNFLGGIVWRIKTADLDSDNCSSVKVHYWTGNGQNPALVQGAGNQRVMHWASAGSATNQISITRATDSSGTATVFTRTITSYLNTERPPKGTTTSSTSANCPLTDGTDPCIRANDRINTGYRAAGEVGWFWMVRQGPGRPWPHVRGVRFTPGPNPTLIDEPDIWNNNHAWIYPTVGVDAAGHEAVIAYQVGGSFFPKPAAALIDDVAPDTDWTSLFFHGLGSSTQGANTWGDYESVRPYDHCDNTYAGAVQQMNGATPQHRFVWFGRERDACPDLTTTSVKPGRTSVAPGHLVRVHHSLRNTGVGDAPASISNFFWSADTTQSSDDIKSPDTTSTGVIAPTDTKKMPVVGIPAPKKEGTYYLLACADGPGAFTEISDNNNCLAADAPVVVEKKSTARVSSIASFPTHVIAGARLPLAVRVLQPRHAAKRAVTVFLSSRSAAGGRLTRIGTVTAGANRGGGARNVKASGRLRLSRSAPKARLQFLIACIGRPRADRCVVAPRPLVVLPRSARVVG
jgi:hypothetical protein